MRKNTLDFYKKGDYNYSSDQPVDTLIQRKFFGWSAIESPLEE